MLELSSMKGPGAAGPNLWAALSEADCGRAGNAFTGLEEVSKANCIASNQGWKEDEVEDYKQSDTCLNKTKWNKAKRNKTKNRKG